MKVSNSQKKMFSTLEVKVIQAIDGRKKTNVKKIKTKVFAHKKAPLDAGNLIAQTIRRINRKCDYHCLPWFLNKASGGRVGNSIWVDKK